jgi:hypothetical protein
LKHLKGKVAINRLFEDQLVNTSGVFMKKLFLIFLVLSLLVASPVLGGQAIPTSADYLKYCQETIKAYEGGAADKSSAGSCLGYVEGALGMHAAFSASGQGKPFYCMPEQGISSFDAVSIWVEYLENNPQKLSNAPVITFILSLNRLYPCVNSKK